MDRHCRLDDEFIYGACGAGAGHVRRRRLVPVLELRRNLTNNPPSETGLAVGKHVGEDPDWTRQDEVVGYLVIEAGPGLFEGLPYDAGVGPDTVMGPDNGTPAQYPVSSSASVLVSQNAMDGAEGGWAVVTSRSASSIGLVIEEDLCTGTERMHTTEQVAYLVFGDPPWLIFADGFETGDTSMWSE